MKVRDQPVRVRLVAADQPVSLGLGPRRRLGEARHLERHVVNSRAARREEPVEEAVDTRRLDHLDGAAALEAPGRPAETPARTARIRTAAEPTDEDVGGVRHPLHPDGDVVELRAASAAHRACSVRHATSAIVVGMNRTPTDLRETLERAVADPAEAVTRAEPAPRESVRLVAEPVILVTGFEPFGSATMNPSQDLAKALDGRRIGNCAVAGAILPVHHLEASRHVSVLLEEMAPVAVVHLGLAEGRTRLALERAALNVMDYRIPDNAGYRAEGEPCVPEGPAAYFASLPLPEILAALTGEGIPAYVSNTAGTFLCNQTLYRTLHEISDAGADGARRVHPPPAPAGHGRARARRTSRAWTSR